MIRFNENANHDSFDELVQTRSEGISHPLEDREQMVTLVHNGLMPES